MYHFYEPPSLIGIEPRAAHAAGGLRVTLHGVRFDAYGYEWQARCRFNDAVARAVSKNATAIVCIAPPSSLPRHAHRKAALYPRRGVERISVSIDDGITWVGGVDSSASPIELERYDASVVSLSPAAGPSAGGFLLRVYGEGMLALPDVRTSIDSGDFEREPGTDEGGAVASKGPFEPSLCVFGSVTTVAVGRSSTWIECLAPPATNPNLTLSGDAQTSHLQYIEVSVRVSLRGHDFLPTAAGRPLPMLQYYPEPALHSLMPSAGPSIGGTQVTIRGDLPAVEPSEVRCQFGDRPVLALSSTSSEVVCATPLRRRAALEASLEVVDVEVSFKRCVSDADKSNLNPHPPTHSASVYR